MTQQQPLVRRRFFSLFRNFTFLVFGRGIKKKNVWRCDGTEAHNDKYDKYANTPKSAG